MRLGRYPEYKESGVEWLGAIPSNWDLKPGLCAFKEKKVKNKDNKEKTVLSLSYGRIVIKPLEKLHGLVPESFETYQVVDKGDIIIRCTDLQNDKVSLRVGQVKNRGIITSAYLCLNTNGCLTPDYGYWLLNTYDLMKIFYNMGSGLRQNLDYTDIKRMAIPVPSKSEQNQITRFLVYKCAQIAKFINNKQRLIQLLQEQRQAIINQAVTRGIDPNVKMKPSGVDWLGDVPMYWNCFQLKRIAKFNPTKAELGNTVDMSDIVVFLPMERVSIDGKVDCKEKRKLAEVWNGFTYFKKGDVIVAKITPCFENGKGAYLDSLETKFGFGTTEFVVIRPLKDIYGKFLYYITMSSKFRKDGEEVMTGAAGQKRVPTDFIKNYIVALPPVNEQLMIINFIIKKNLELDRAITKANHQIILIQEYRTRLISDIVTGKLDVRSINIDKIEDIDDIPAENPIDDLSPNEEEIEGVEAEAEEEDSNSNAAEEDTPNDN